MNLSLGKRSPKTVLLLSVWNVVAHVHRQDMSVDHIAQILQAKWTPGPLTPPPTVESVLVAAKELCGRGFAEMKGDVLQVPLRDGMGKGLPLFVVDAARAE